MLVKNFETGEFLEVTSYSGIEDVFICSARDGGLIQLHSRDCQVVAHHLRASALHCEFVGYTAYKTPLVFKVKLPPPNIPFDFKVIVFGECGSPFRYWASVESRTMFGRGFLELIPMEGTLKFTVVSGETAARSLVGVVYPFTAPQEIIDYLLPVVTATDDQGQSLGGLFADSQANN